MRTKKRKWLTIQAFYSLSILCAFCVSCKDREWGESEEEKPVWLGGSIYQELKSPNPERMEGTFGYFVRLVDDLGYAETLNRTGSKTLFPANDEAFEQFFKNNTWGVSCYEELTTPMKKQILYTAMLDNAYLVKMLSNVSATQTSVERGKAIRHSTQLSVTDSVSHLTGQQLNAGPLRMFANNTAWDPHRQDGIYYLSDATNPMMVHFTREQMLNNGITVTGTESDFEIITGNAFEDGMAYIFRTPIIHKDVTCMNGYIQQVRDVLLPPGNMAQVVRSYANTKLFSRVLDRFSAPYQNEGMTQLYNDWAQQNGQPQIPAIYEIRYPSLRSQGSALNTDPYGNVVQPENLLLYDPGWNGYFPNGSTDISDMGVMFVPDDEAMRRHFLPGGGGAFMVEQFGRKPNTIENLEENLDSIPKSIMATFVNNLIKSSFVDAVPSKFTTIVNTASENMGMDIGYLRKDNEGKYDVKIANNGVIYILNDVIMPDEYQAVSAPTLFNDELSVMRWAVSDKTIYKNGQEIPSVLGLDFWAYLLAMSANFAFFIPDDTAFDRYVVDPVSLLPGQTPSGLHFFTTDVSPFIGCRRTAYDKETGTFGAEIPQNINISTVSTQMGDILNTHTIVLDKGDTVGLQNHYFRTKQGAAIYIDHEGEGSKLSATGNTNVSTTSPKDVTATVTKLWNEKNGRSYRIDRVLQTPLKGVYSILKENSQFSEFLNLCEGFEVAAEQEILDWLGYGKTAVPPAVKSEQEQLMIFAKAMQKMSDGTLKQVSLDYNTTLFNSYHYTVYAPNNKAIQTAYEHGLPRWSDIKDIYSSNAYHGSVTETNAKRKAKEMVQTIHRFICYHLQSGYVFADNKIDAREYQTLQMGDNDQFMKLTIGGGQGTINVTDGAGVTHNIVANTTGKVVNALAREYIFNYVKDSDIIPEISTSSYAVIHEIDEPLYYQTSQSFD